MNTDIFPETERSYLMTPAGAALVLLLIGFGNQRDVDAKTARKNEKKCRAGLRLARERGFKRGGEIIRAVRAADTNRAVALLNEMLAIVPALEFCAACGFGSENFYTIASEGRSPLQ